VQALPPKHTRGVSKAADAIQGANADPANSNGSAHLGGSHASGVLFWGGGAQMHAFTC